MEATKETLKSLPTKLGAAFAGNKKQSLILMFFALLVFCVVAGVTIYMMVTKYANMVQVSYVDSTNSGVQSGTVPIVMTNAVTFSGQTCTILFWAYINSMPGPGNDFALVSFGTAPTPTPGATAIPGSAAANANQNITCTVHTSGPPSISMTMACATTTCTTQESVQVPYMPTKRWVHYALTVDLNAKSMSVYVDGEIVQQGAVTSASAFPTGTSLIIGGTQSLQMLVSRVGYVSTVMAAQDIQREYYKGPIYSKYSFLGLSSYGLRSPIVKNM